MGCSSPQNAGIPNIAPQYLSQLQQVSDINHSLNVNKKYEHLCLIHQDRQCGSDYKKTFIYECRTTREELQKSRKEFWQTRVNGNPDCWAAIKMAIQEPDQSQGRMILNRMKIYLLNNSIQMCVDSKKNKYQVPVFCLNEPISYSEVTLNNQNLNFTYEDQEVVIKIRSTRFPNQDICIKEKMSTQIHVIKTIIKTMKQELGANSKIRLFYSGREMQDDKALGNYGFISGLIIQAMII